MEDRAEIHSSPQQAPSPTPAPASRDLSPSPAQHSVLWAAVASATQSITGPSVITDQEGMCSLKKGGAKRETSAQLNLPQPLNCTGGHGCTSTPSCCPSTTLPAVNPSPFPFGSSIDLLAAMGWIISQELGFLLQPGGCSS